MDQPLWVFGYGSLIWNPGFRHDEAVVARLDGYRRSFCMHSIHHRGQPGHPGLVLALDPAQDDCCHGLAFRVPATARAATLDYLRARELVSSAYVERWCAVQLADGRQIEGLVYVVDTEHVQYATGMSLEDQAQVIARAHGDRGPNTEYLYNTAAHLAELGLSDPELDWLTKRVRVLENG